MEPLPLVSIVIPVFNGSDYLRDAIECALRQTYRSCEVLVINDGSTDNGQTEKIAQSYGERIRYFRKENGGVSSALNLAISEMRGTYFTWLSHDDLYTQDKVQLQVEAVRLSGNPKTLVYSDYDVLLVDTGKTIHHLVGQLASKEKMEDSLYPVLYNMIHGCSVLVHKSHFEEHGIFDERLRIVQDYDLWFRIFRGHKHVFLSKSLVIGREHCKQVGKRAPMQRIVDEMEQHYMRMANALTTDEIRHFYGNAYNFYYRMFRMETFSPVPGFQSTMYRAFLKEPQPPDTLERIGQFYRELMQAGGTRLEGICIMGAGKYGREIRRELHVRGIEANCFYDNNQTLWGKQIDGLPCISFPELEAKKDRLLVIPAIQVVTDLITQLTEYGFPYYKTRHALNMCIESVWPLKQNVWQAYGES